MLREDPQEVEHLYQQTRGATTPGEVDNMATVVVTIVSTGGNNTRRQHSNQFQGREESLRGHIIDYTREHLPDQFIKTTKEIESYVGCTNPIHTGVH